MSRKKIADMTQDERAALALTVAGLRERQRMLQSELGEATGMTRQTISNIERGATRPNASTLVKIFEALGVSESPEFDQQTESWLVMLGEIIERIPTARRPRAVDTAAQFLLMSVGADITDFALAAKTAQENANDEDEALGESGA